MASPEESPHRAARESRGPSGMPRTQRDAAGARTGPDVGREIARAAMLFGASLLLCLVAYVALTVPGKLVSGRRPQGVDRARPRADARERRRSTAMQLVVTAIDASGLALVTLNTNFRSSDYPAIAWTATGVSEQSRRAAALELRLRRRHASIRCRSTVASGRLLPVVARQRSELGRAASPASRWRSAARCRSRCASPASSRNRWAPSRSLRDRVARVARLRELERVVDQHGDRRRRGAGTAPAAPARGRAPPRRGALVRRRPSPRGHRRVAVGPGSAVRHRLDRARSALDVESRAAGRRDGAAYAGKDWRERHLAAEDGPLFAFIEKVRAKLPATPGARDRGRRRRLLPRPRRVPPLSAQRLSSTRGTTRCPRRRRCAPATTSSSISGAASSTTPRSSGCAGTAASRSPPNCWWPRPGAAAFRIR